MKIKHSNGVFYSELRNQMVGIFQHYMASDEWKELRQDALDRDGNACVDCGQTKKLIAHHDSYDNWGKCNDEELGDLVTVCPKCHNARHRKMEIPFFAKRNFDPLYMDSRTNWTMEYVKEINDKLRAK